MQYHITTKEETLEPHMYIDRYKDPEVKNLLHTYKFTPDIHSSIYREAKEALSRKTLDICLEKYISSRQGMIVYTAPPSTMFARGEKQVDSMFELLRSSSLTLLQLVQQMPGIDTCVDSIFSISHTYLKEKRAQHIDGTRKSRIKDIRSRYVISIKHILYLFYCIRIRKIRHFSYLIVDDVSSTGATLVACKETLLSKLSLVHRKNPHITYDVRIFSLSH
ncbi:MAG: hypothetical protein V4686_03995 [Patescibacteria group bacterium]